MVLQNKYKARVSRRYNAARGGASDGRGRGGGGRGRGRGRSFTTDPASFPSLDGQADIDDDAGQGSQDDAGEDEDELRPEKSKFAPRKLTSNAWRFQKDEEQEQGTADGGEAESEPEVDLSAVLKHVVNLDSSRTSQAISSERLARDKLDADAADVDVSLLPLIQRRQRREDEEAAAASRKGKGGRTGESSSGITSKRFLEGEERRAPQRHALTDEERRELEQEGRRLQIEKERQEKHERRARILQQQSKIMSLDSAGKLKKSAASKGSLGIPDERDREAHLYVDDDEAQEWNKDGQDTVANGQADDLLDGFVNEDNYQIARKPRDIRQQHIQAPNRSRQARALRAPPPPAENATTEEDFLDSVLS